MQGGNPQGIARSATMTWKGSNHLLILIETQTIFVENEQNGNFIFHSGSGILVAFCRIWQHPMVRAIYE